MLLVFGGLALLPLQPERIRHPLLERYRATEPAAAVAVVVVVDDVVQQMREDH